MNPLKKIVVVGGVSGVGKTTISKLLATKLNLPFYDGDDFHPEANVKKMRSGHALNDEDRKPWLLALGKNISEWERERGAVLACSALKESYRELMQQGAQLQIIWIFLEGSEELIAKRLGNRKDHFFDPHLLKSQFETYKRPSYGFYFNVAPAPELIADEIVGVLMGKSSFGIMGAGVKSIALARKLGRLQLKLSIYDPKTTTSGDSLAVQQLKKYPELAIASGFTDAGEFLENLEKPFKIINMLPNQTVISTLPKIVGQLSKNDVLMNISDLNSESLKPCLDHLSENKVTLLKKDDYINWEGNTHDLFTDPKMSEAFGLIFSYFKQQV